jgi:beta-glucanase (GH16 family)
MRIRAAITLVALMALAISACGGGSGGEHRLTCGGERPAKPGGGSYTCTFSDNFTGSTLDSSKWMVQTTARSGYATGSDCYVNSRNNISVAGGYLHLTSRVEPAPFICHSPLGHFTTSQTAGSVLTFDKFAQTYGRFEFRAKFPSTVGPGVDSALWMYPVKPAYGAWPNSGEIDVAERFGTPTADHILPSVHYAGEDSALSTGHGCVVPTADSAFHTYAVDWTTTTMYFRYDGHLCFQHFWTPNAPLVRPQPFDQAFDLVMTQTGQRGAPVGTTITMDVDWVRAWR